MFKKLPLIVLSLALAYPLSAVPYCVIGMIINPQFAGDTAALFVAFIYFAVCTPLNLGFPLADGSGDHHINMYPYILFTSIVLFLLFTKLQRTSDED